MRSLIATRLQFIAKLQAFQAVGHHLGTIQTVLYIGTVRRSLQPMADTGIMLME